MSKLIYIADDEVNICNIIKSFLEKEGYEVEAFNDGASLLNAFHKRQADMLVIDVMMPEMDGYSLCSAVRQVSNVPIIILSARDGEPDKIAGLTLGADDYLTKPFSPMELVVRIKTLFRRIDLDRKDHAEIKPKALTVMDIELFPESKAASCKGRDLRLTLMEFDLLSYLVQKQNSAVSREELLNKVWGFEKEVETRATDDMIKRIRKKLTAADSDLKVETVWGYGFKIAGSGERT